MLRLLQSWNHGGPARKPWALLDAVGAPLGQESFARWVRAYILRLSSLLFRRYELRLATWPYQDERAEVASALIREDPSMLDIYSRGLRLLFPSVDIFVVG